MEATDCKQLLIGLPGTGKTTFLAALWYVVDSDEVPGSLRLEKLHGDREHLNKIRSDWLSCRTIARTTITSEQLVSMKLTEPNSGRTTEVFFPDMSGESFRLQWKDRSWTKKYDQMVREAAGALLFVHPSEVAEPIRIDTANPLVAAIAEEKNPSSSAQNESIPWNADRTPTQVQLVELLQFLTMRTGISFPFRAA